MKRTVKQSCKEKRMRTAIIPDKLENYNDSESSDSD